jgi:hypothetical protein
LVLEKLLRFEKELVMSLSGFLIFLVPALEDTTPELISKAYEIMAKTEKFVGTSKLYGEIWKTALRTPRARLSALRYLEKKIPKTIDEAVSLNDGSSVGSTNPQRVTKIYPSKYNLVIRQGKMFVEVANYPENPDDIEDANLPGWALQELGYLETIQKATKDLESLKRGKIEIAKQRNKDRDLSNDLPDCLLDDHLEAERS